MVQIQHIHPMLVHFPIVFVLTLAVVDVVAGLARAPFLGRGALGTVSMSLALLGGTFAVAAFAFGGIALDFAEQGGFRSDVAEIHEALGTATAAGLGLWALVRLVLWYRDVQGGLGRALVPMVELGGAAAVLATAYYGGQLVFDLGVNVARVASAG